MAVTARKKMSDYRKRLRDEGLRPVQVWVADTRSPALVRELRRQSKLVSQHRSDREGLDFIESAFDWDESR